MSRLKRSSGNRLAATAAAASDDEKQTAALELFVERSSGTTPSPTLLTRPILTPDFPSGLRCSAEETRVSETKASVVSGKDSAVVNYQLSRQNKGGIDKWIDASRFTASHKFSSDSESERVTRRQNEFQAQEGKM